MMDTNLLEFRIYNVGQANCSSLILYSDADKTDYRVLYIFDCGLKTKKNKSIDELINKIDEKTILVISHPHYDHICNFDILFNKRIQRIIYSDYFFKNYKSRFINRIVFSKIMKLPDAKMMENDIVDIVKISSQKPLHLDPNQPLNDINSMSLVAQLNIHNQQILIPGDRLYGNIPNSLVQKYEHILIPHHCCEYNIKNPAIKFISNDTTGYIMSGHTLTVTQTSIIHCFIKTSNAFLQQNII